MASVAVDTPVDLFQQAGSKRNVADFFGGRRISKRLRPVMPAEIVLKETYHNKKFLDHLGNQGPDCSIDIDKFVKPAQKIVKRTSTNPVSTIKYHRIEYKIGNGQTAIAGRYYPSIPCYQNLPGTVRRIVANDMYAEVDLVNAHPNILLLHYPTVRALLY